MRGTVWGAHPFVWAFVCALVAVGAILLATVVFSDPHGAERRAFLRQCHDQAFDRGVADRCSALAQARFGRFNGLPRDLAYLVAAVSIFAGTAFVVLFVVRQVGQEVGTGSWRSKGP